MKTGLRCDHCGDDIDDLDVARVKMAIHTPLMPGIGRAHVCGCCAFDLAQYLAKHEMKLLGQEMPDIADDRDDYRKRLSDAIAEEEALQGLRGGTQGD